MKRLSRRDFLSMSAMGLGAAALSSGITSDPVLAGNLKLMKMPLGFQVWTIKDALIKDFPGTLKMMADLGYKSVEMCSPPGYESSGFGPLMKYKPREMKKIINDAGLQFLSTHYGMSELKKNLSERIDFAAESGQKQIILSSFGLPKTATLSDWKKAADELNSVGEKTKASGIQTGYHNHHMEFDKLEGTLIYDALMEQFNPDFVKMQFQVAVISIGYKASDYFNKYPGRFISAHLADWSAETQKSVPCGKGSVDWKEFFGALKTGGVKNIFAEIDQSFFKESAEYFNNL
jgi:sugar phosphate isomerase/epimerase